MPLQSATLVRLHSCREIVTIMANDHAQTVISQACMLAEPSAKLIRITAMTKTSSSRLHHSTTSKNERVNDKEKIHTVD